MTVLASLGSDTENSKDRNSLLNDEDYVQNFVNQMLARRLFRGVYTERRWVEPLKQYRDVVVINSKNEKLIEDLKIVKRKLKEFYGDSKWIGISDPECIGAPAGYCFWLKLHNIPLGEHEFRIKKVEFSNEEIRMSIKSIKWMDSTSETSLREENENVEFIRDTSFYLDEAEKNLKELFKIISGLLTAKNIKASVKLLIFLLVAIFTFLIEVIKWLGEFTIRFMHEFSNLIHVCMPLFLSIIELIQKIIGGGYVLLAMMWRSWMGGNPPHMQIGQQLPRVAPPYNYCQQNYNHHHQNNHLRNRPYPQNFPIR